MGVSRLDNFKLLTNLTTNTTGVASAQEAPLPSFPINALVSVFVYGTFDGTATVSIEVTPDGVNWLPAATATPASLTAAGVLTWHGVATGIRAKVTGATASNISAIAVFNDQNGCR